MEDYKNSGPMSVAYLQHIKLQSIALVLDGGLHLQSHIGQSYLRIFVLSHNVNVVIFAGGNFSQKCWQDITRGGNFHDTSPVSFIKAYGFYFGMG